MVKKFCVLILLFLFSGSTEAHARDIRVMLSSSGKYAIKSDSNIIVVDAKGATHNIGKSGTLAVSGGTVAIAGKKVPLPVAMSGKPFLGFKGYKYRGVLRITKGGALVNILDVEDYVRGVLKAEANPNWHMEYLKVQAIVSRTYGLREQVAAQSREYDVVDSTASQVYHGASAETPRTDNAVRETANKVLAYGNELAGTFFHSDSGGATANITDVWGGDMPYLRAVKEPVHYTSPNSSWEKKMSAEDVSRSLQKVAPNVGAVSEIRILNTDAFGRAVDLKITGSKGTATMKASAFRTALGPNGIKSTFLTAAGTPPPQKPTPQRPAPKPTPNPTPAPAPKKNIDFTTPMTSAEEDQLRVFMAEGKFSGKEMTIILTKPEKRKELLYKLLAELGMNEIPKGKTLPAPTITPPFDVEIPKPINTKNPEVLPLASGKTIPFVNGQFIFNGRGWGHGVGLSQYGGMALANEGWKAERILTHYFPGTAVKVAK